MEALNDLVKAGKVRALGASAMYGYQFHDMQFVAEKIIGRNFLQWRITTIFYIVKMNES